MPHPSEPIVNVRLQTLGRPAADVFREGLEQLAEVADHVQAVFDAAIEAGPAVGMPAGMRPAPAAPAGGKGGGRDADGDVHMKGKGKKG
jgi:hypothetical protein